ncbi:hypothetical protein P7K49_002675 [Saguinus oedipus]|uniref:Uncharacterized protein n=1 Tax=Saguinus oedipus TaxID=9490 RepID=A0ABQ9WI09_SAGOE|nr:hypothetical protein P7K49_002675 [Saguinus oedipus]
MAREWFSWWICGIQTSQRPKGRPSISSLLRDDETISHAGVTPSCGSHRSATERVIRLPHCLQKPYCQTGPGKFPVVAVFESVVMHLQTTRLADKS